MSPVDRARVSVTEKRDEDDPWSIFDKPLEVIEGGKYEGRYDGSPLEDV